MNILYYDDKIPLEGIYEIWRSLKANLPKEELLALPSSTQLLINVPAEELFNIGDRIWVALEKIREERPEEYQQAKEMRAIETYKRIMERNKHGKEESV
jgi:hypothetical protein